MTGRVRLPRLGAAGLALTAAAAGLALAVVPAAGAVTGPAGLGAASACPTPAVTAAATASGAQAGAPGTTVYVTGSNLSASACTTSVTLGSQAVAVSDDSSGRLQFTMPANRPGGPVQVTLTDVLGGSASSNADHDFVALPTVSGLSTRSPVEGADLSASGHGFGLAGLPGAAAAISYCGGPAQPAAIGSDTTLSLPGPQAFCSGPASIRFSTPSLSVTVSAGRVTVAPSISSVQPGGPVAPGATLVASGSGFGPSGSAFFGRLEATVSNWTDRSVSVVVPGGAASGSFTLVRSDGVATASPSITVRQEDAPAGPAATAPPSPPSPSPPSSPGPVAALQASAVTGPAAVAAVAPVATGPSSAAPVITEAPGTSSAIAAAEGLGAAPERPAPLSTSPSVSPVAQAVATVAPRSLPMPWLVLATLLLAAVAAAYVLTMRQDSVLIWRAAGYLGAAALALTYLVTAVSVLLTLLTDWLPGAGTATLPGAGLYKATAVMLSVVLTGIAARYVYYYWCWAKSRHHFAHPRPLDPAVLAGRDLPYMKFQVTTRGGAGPVLERTVGGIVGIASAQPWLAGRMSVEVVTESVSDADDLAVRFAGGPIPVDAVVVAPGYQTPKGTGLKARALHHMVEKRLEGWNAKPGRTFVVHLDEETLVTEEHLLVLVDYLSRDPRPISQGPILYPLEWDRTPWMCRAMESLRPFGCSECARVMSNPPPPHLHGSNLVVDEEVENRIGWDFGTVAGQPYLAEDLMFGLRAYALLGEEGFGWHGATMLEQPPLSVYWAVQQRLRWVLGALQGWWAMGQRDDLRAIPAAKRNRLRRAVAFRVATYSLGFPVGFAGLYFLLHPAVHQSALVSPLGIWRLFITLAGLGWVLSYQIGLARNLRYQDVGVMSRLRQHLTLLLLTPVTGLFETAGPFLALTRWLVGARQARWTPTPKTAEAPAPSLRPAARPVTAS
jgi:hypothetical protein